jgi:multiple sugar transport system permease protein
VSASYKADKAVRRYKYLQRKSNTMKRSTLHNALIYLLLIVLTAIIFFPIFWMISTAFKEVEAAAEIPPHWIPETFTLENFRNLLKDRSGFLTFTKNSFIVCTGTTLVCIVCASLTGYGLSRMRFKGRTAVMISILSTQMFPLSLILIPMYMLFRRLHLIDTYTGLIIAFTTFGLPFSIWMMKGFFDTVPKELEEAAYIDGCSPLRTLWQIVLPLVAPGVVCIGFYSFLQGWNNLLFPLTLTTRLDMRTIPPGFILTYVGEYEYYWTDMMAASTAVAIPVVLLFMVLQKYYIAGLTGGAVKY